MKTIQHVGRLLAVLTIGCAGVSAGGGVSPGDDRAAVIAALGEPSGEMILPNDHRLYYPRGVVRMRDGVVVEAALLSEEDAQARWEEQMATATAAASAIAAHKVARRAEGERVARAWLADPEFRVSPVSFQVERWAEFARKYPDVDVATYMADVVQKLQTDAAREDLRVQTALGELRRSNASTALIVTAPVRVSDFHPYSYVRVSGGGSVYSSSSGFYAGWSFGPRYPVVYHVRDHRPCGFARPPGGDGFGHPAQSARDSWSAVSTSRTAAWPYDFGFGRRSGW